MNSNSNQILPIFPQPVAMFQLSEPSTEELEFILAQELRPNVSNKTSVDSNILEKPEMVSIKQEINDSLDWYMENVFSPKENETELYVTQSWCNYSNKGDSHHIHDHANSIVSGVYYPQVTEGDQIVFHKQRSDFPLKLKTENFNLFNSETWFVPVAVGNLVLFPSSLSHNVPPVVSETTRISLSFNTYFSGTMGVEGDLTQLILPQGR